MSGVAAAGPCIFLERAPNSEQLADVWSGLQYLSPDPDLFGNGLRKLSPDPDRVLERAPTSGPRSRRALERDPISERGSPRFWSGLRNLRTGPDRFLERAPKSEPGSRPMFAAGSELRAPMPTDFRSGPLNLSPDPDRILERAGKRARIPADLGKSPMIGPGSRPNLGGQSKIRAQIPTRFGTATGPKSEPLSAISMRPGERYANHCPRLARWRVLQSWSRCVRLRELRGFNSPRLSKRPRPSSSAWGGAQGKENTLGISAPSQLLPC